MARSSTQAILRRQELERLLLNNGQISVNEMAERFRVDPITIRRDLKVLEKSGVIIRRYGGAVAAHRIAFEFSLDERHRRHMVEKKRIARAAVERIEKGTTIFMDTGTTTYEIARALLDQEVSCRVVTNNLLIASELWARPQVEIFLLGGLLRRDSPHLIGPGAEILLEKLTADVAFLGSEGIDPVRGSFTMDTEEASIDESMASNARRVIVVADHSKLGSAGSVRYLRIEDMSELITDRGADEAIVQQLRDSGVKVTLA